MSNFLFTIVLLSSFLLSACITKPLEHGQDSVKITLIVKGEGIINDSYSNCKIDWVSASDPCSTDKQGTCTITTNKRVKLSPKPTNPDSYFSAWSDASNTSTYCNGREGACFLNADSDITITANFKSKITRVDRIENLIAQGCRIDNKMKKLTDQAHEYNTTPMNK